MAGLDVLWLWGTREQIGHAEGALLCGRIPRFFAHYYLDHLVPLLRTSYSTLSAKLLARYRIPPDDEKELRAVLRGIRERCAPADRMVESAHLERWAGGRRELRYEDLVFVNIVHELFLGCSSFTVWGSASASRATLHARNVDFMLDPSAAYTREQILKVYSATEPQSARWAGLSWPGSLVCHTCFAEDGLGFTVNGTNVRPPSAATSRMPLGSALRRALLAAIGDRDPLEAMVSSLQKSPIRTGANLSVFWPCRGDTGCVGGAMLEHDGDASHRDGRVTLRRPGEGDRLLSTRAALIATNHYLKRVPEPPRNPVSLEHYRLLRTGIEDSAKAGGVDVRRARALMSATAARGDVLTAITIILDAATHRLLVFRSTGAKKAATEHEPSVIDLAKLFSGFPVRR